MNERTASRNRKVKSIKKTTTKFPELKNLLQNKNSLDEINSRLGWQERVSVFFKIEIAQCAEFLKKLEM